jgi:pantoate--beta-alanine ligase
MGNLHAGHLELVKVAKFHADFVVVSIYVNPTQFGANEDLEAYPSTPAEDARALAEVGADLLFLPADDVMYPGNIDEQTVVSVPKMHELYCGENRPVHFNGVTTVVSRLFNMVQPDAAVFGKKDYQQVAIIRKMVKDLAYPIEIIGVDTVRDDNGLALSSRNGYLTDAQLEKAAALRQTLQWMAQELESSLDQKVDFSELEEVAKQKLKTAGFTPHYVTVCRQSDLQPPKGDESDLVILAAAVMGKARLIDNLEINRKSS